MSIIQSQLSLVCHLEVVGFDNLMAQSGLEAIADKFSALAKAAENEYQSLLQYHSTQKIEASFLKYTFGSFGFCNRLLFWCPFDQLNLDILLETLTEVMCKSIELGLPMKGAVSAGQIVADRDSGLLLGEPFSDAAKALSARNWIGLSLSKNFDLPQFNCSFRAGCILEYSSGSEPSDESLVIPLVIDYPRRWRLTRERNLSQALTEMLNHAETLQLEENSLHFAKFSADNHDWWLRHPAYLAELEREKWQTDRGETGAKNHS